MRWIWFIPLSALVLWTAWLGIRWGIIAASITESDVIDAYAQRYLEDRARDGSRVGASLSDCVAYPGEEKGTWLVISCGPSPYDASLHYEYYVDRLGQLRYSGGPYQWGATPPSRQVPEI